MKRFAQPPTWGVLAKACAFISAVCLLSGCAWRTTRADHLLGPAMYRYAEPSAERATAFQSLHFPLLVEGGHQWGISVGGIQRFALAPARMDFTNSLTSEMEMPRGWLIDPKPGRWRWSWFYLRAPVRHPPEFIWRRLVGIHGGVGRETRAITLGYSSVTALTPRQEAIYELDFNSRRPLEATFVANSLAEAVKINRNDPSNKENHHD